MNIDHVQGAVRQAAGQVQKAFGKVVGSPSHHVRGATREIQARAQRAVGDARQLVKDATRKS